MQEGRRLFTFDFVILNFVVFFAFCNMAVFYSFYGYMDKLGIPLEWRGFLVGLEPMSAFLLRLAAVPFLHLGNAAGAMLLALIMLVTALCSYPFTETIPAIAFLRIFHGAAFVLLVSASMTLVVNFIPKDRTAQGFGIVSLATLIPYAVMPVITEALLRQGWTEPHIYAGVTILAAPALILLSILRSHLRRSVGSTQGLMAKRPGMSEFRQNMREPGVTLLLGVNLLMYLSYSMVFFFVKSYAADFDSGHVGIFFTISTAMMILVRASGGIWMDKINKLKALIVFMVFLIPFFVLLSFVKSPALLYLLAGWYGLCVGVILPLLNSVMFLLSPPHLRGLNTNLSLFMMDAGFFLSPYFGGLWLSGGFSVGSLFNFCAGFLTLALVLLLVIGQRGRNRQALAVNAAHD
ncbi:MAG: MFS transporter [Syntrophobacteraceae bacterium]